eukprot:tig00020848_g14543.t1
MRLRAAFVVPAPPLGCNQSRGVAYAPPSTHIKPSPFCVAHAAAILGRGRAGEVKSRKFDFALREERKFAGRKPRPAAPLQVRTAFSRFECEVSYNPRPGSIVRPVVTIRDNSGLEPILMCIDEVTRFDGDEYVLLSALDTPVEVFVWEEGLPQMQEHTLAVPVHVESPLLSDIWPALGRHMADKFKLKMLRTSMTVTVQGKIPSLLKADKFIAQEEDDFEPQEYRVLTRVKVGNAGYAIVVPVPSPQFFGRRAPDGTVELLDDDDYEAVGDQLSEIFDELADQREEEEAAMALRVDDSDDDSPLLDDDHEDGQGGEESWPPSYVEVPNP